MIPWRLKDGTPQSSDRREVTGLLWSHVPLPLSPSLTFPYSVATLLISLSLSLSLPLSLCLSLMSVLFAWWRFSFLGNIFRGCEWRRGKVEFCFGVGQHVYGSLLSGWHFPLSSIISLFIPPFILCLRTGLSSSSSCIPWTILGKPKRLLSLPRSLSVL